MLKGKKVLTVDDDPEFQNLLAGMLVNLGLFVSISDNLEKFMLKLNEESPDIALIDKNLGDEDGFDLIHEIRKNSNQSSIPVIVISGDATKENRYEAIKIGADYM